MTQLRVTVVSASLKNFIRHRRRRRSTADAGIFNHHAERHLRIFRRRESHKPAVRDLIHVARPIPGGRRLRGFRTDWNQWLSIHRAIRFLLFHPDPGALRAARLPGDIDIP